MVRLRDFVEQNAHFPWDARSEVLQPACAGSPFPLLCRFPFFRLPGKTLTLVSLKQDKDIYNSVIKIKNKKNPRQTGRGFCHQMIFDS